MYCKIYRRCPPDLVSPQSKSMSPFIKDRLAFNAELYRSPFHVDHSQGVLRMLEAKLWGEWCHGRGAEAVVEIHKGRVTLVDFCQANDMKQFDVEKWTVKFLKASQRALTCGPKRRRQGSHSNQRTYSRSLVTRAPNSGPKKVSKRMDWNETESS